MLTFTHHDPSRLCISCHEPFIPLDMRQIRCRHNCQRDFKRTRPVTFVGVDGEGLGSDPSVYVLLGCGDKQIENPEGLSWKECFQFLYTRYMELGGAKSNVAFVGFFLGYDFTQILKTLPEERARMLLTEVGQAKRKHRIKGKQPHPVEYGGWQFDIMGMKRLRIRPKTCRCNVQSCACPNKASWLFICDVGGFWQTSFLNVIDPRNWIDPVVSAEEYSIVEIGKDKRRSAVLDEDMRKYNRLENTLLARVMNSLNLGFEDIGIHLSRSRWYGPGQGSAVWLKKRMPKKDLIRETIPDWFMEASRKSYYGGWFEIFVHGVIKGITHEYDINSAYPHVIASLPCLLHGEYTTGIGRPSLAERDICLVRARVWSRSPYQDKSNRRQYIGSMLHRTSSGSILRPGITDGWFWWDELEEARRAGCITRISDDRIYEWVKYHPCDCPPPLADVKGLYEKRLQVGKDTAKGKGAKLIYNSMYGKFAQSIGMPQFGNAVYASRITSGCRKMALRAIASHPGGLSEVAMVATDAVFFLSEHPGLDVGEGLGQWGYKARKNLTIFKPGVYWDDETRRQIVLKQKPKFKARGINAAEFAGSIAVIDVAFNEWDVSRGHIEWPKVKFHTDFSMVTCKQALARGAWETAGKNIPKPLTQDSDPHNKRTGVYWDSEREVWRSEYKWPEWDQEIEDYDCVSTPYVKRFGMEDPFSEESKEEYGVTEDGLVGDQMRWLLKNDE